jgi:hypothetical protein
LNRQKPNDNADNTRNIIAKIGGISSKTEKYDTSNTVEKREVQGIFNYTLKG